MLTPDDVHKFRRHIPDFEARVEAIAHAQIGAVRLIAALIDDCVEAVVRALTGLASAHAAMPVAQSAADLADPELRAFMHAVVTTMISDLVEQAREDVEFEADPKATVVVQPDDCHPADETHEACVRQFIRYATRAEMDQLNLALAMCARPARAHYYSTSSEIDVPVASIEIAPAADDAPDSRVS